MKTPDLIPAMCGRMSPRTTALTCAVALSFTAVNVEALSFDYLKIAESGQTAPGSTDTFTGFGDVAVDDQGNVAFEADVRGSFSIEGVYAFSNNTLSRITDEATPLPGLTRNIGSLDDHVEIRGGTSAFNGRYSDNNNDALVLSDGTTSRVVLEENVSVLPSIGNPTVTGIGDSEGYGFDGTRVAFQAGFNGGNGIYLDPGNGALTRIADTNDATPGGSNFGRFNNAMPDANGPGVLFDADIDNFTSDGIYLATDGTMNTVTKVAESNDFTLVPGATDVQFGTPDIDAGRIVFVASQVDNVNFDTLAITLELWENGVLSTLVDQSTALPGGLTASGLGDTAAIAGDYIAFFADTDADFTTDAIYLIDTSDDTIYDVIKVGQTLDGQEVTGINSDNRPFLSDGYLAFDLTLDNTTRAVYRAEILSEPTGPAVVPTPTAGVMGLIGLGGLIVARRRR